MKTDRSILFTGALLMSAMTPCLAAVCASNVTTPSPTDVAVTASSDGQLHMFYTTDIPGTLARRYGPASNPTGLTFQNLGGTAGSEPSAASWGPGHAITALRGSNGALWYLQWDGASASGWQSLGGQVTWNPSVVATAPGKVTIFYRGADRQLYYVDGNAGTWGTHTSLGGVLTSSPAAVSWGASHVAVFKRGQDNGLWYRQRTGTSWSAWVSLGGNFSVDPVAVSAGTGQIDVFVRSAGNIISRISYRAGAWGTWHSLGAPSTIFDGISEPGAVATPSGALTVFARGMVIKGHNGNPDTMAVYSRTSTDGGATWTNWTTVHAMTGFNLSAVRSNPQATAVSHTGWTVAAPTGSASIPMTLCTGP